MQAFFARGRAETDGRSTLPLHINNCGYYRDLESEITLDRPDGRRDYHLVFVSEGSVTTESGAIAAGECILYRPGVPQRYVYGAGRDTHYIWVHFSGRDAEELLCGVPSGIICYRESAAQVHELLQRAIRAIAEGMDCADLYAEGLFRAVVALLRSRSTKPPFARAIAMMREFSVHRTVKEYADASGMSEGHFIRAFRDAYGVTPLEYRTALQIDCAKSLLVGTPLRIGAIASAAGFSDALYFSRVFRKKTGRSPSEYREGK